MGIVVQGAAASQIRGESVCVVHYKKNWVDTWKVSSNLVPISAERHVASAGGSRCTLLGRYGPSIKQTDTAGFGAVTALDFSAVQNHWVKLSIFNKSVTSKPVFVGRVNKENGVPHGSANLDSHGRPAAQGDKIYHCYGPEDMLERINFHKSFWTRDEGVSTYELGWLPSFNRRGDQRHPSGGNKRHRLLDGNRTAQKHNDSYIFGGTDRWSRFDAAEYILNRFVNQTGGPAWTISGQLDFLKTTLADVEMGPVENAWDTLRRLIPAEHGLDFVINPTSTGFNVSVFAMLGQSTVWGGYSYPVNSMRFRVDVSRDIDVADCQIERCSGELYDAFEVIGDRAVSCFSMGPDSGVDPDHQNFLVGKWTPTDVSAYKLGADVGGSSDAHKAENDRVRAADHFRNVYQAFGAPTLFNWQSGRAIPKIDYEGNVLVGQAVTDYQQKSRETLSWLPLKHNVDYRSDPPIDAGSGDEFLPPFAIVLGKFTLGSPPAPPPPAPPQYVFSPVHLDMINSCIPSMPSASVEPLENDWGLRLRTQPNHAMARGQAFPATSLFDPEVNGVNWQTMNITIAVPTDTRLKLRQELPPELKSGSGLTKIIHAPSLQLWWLAPRTIVGLDEAGLRKGPAAGMVLRNDRDNAARMMAGAIARYLRERIRATITFNLVNNFNATLGAILETVDNGEVFSTGQPVSSVVWDFGNARTTVATGQALPVVAPDGEGQPRSRRMDAFDRRRNFTADLPSYMPAVNWALK